MRSVRLLIVLLLLISIRSNAMFKSDSLVFSEVRQVLDAQVVAWNKADIEGFMKGYWNSDSLRFIGKNGIRYGWKATRDNYKKSYPGKAEMGTLRFAVDRCDRLSEDAVLVVGSWALDRETPVGGWFTLLFRYINGQWVIVLDHTS